MSLSGAHHSDDTGHIADHNAIDTAITGLQTNTVSSFNGRKGAVALAKTDVTATGLAKADVGLANVDNTADVDKPVSTATTAALALKANLASPNFTGTPTRNGSLLLTQSDVSGVYPVASLDMAHVFAHTEDPVGVIKEALRRGYTFIFASDLVKAFRGGGTLPPKPIMLSFDDARSQLYSVIHPVIQTWGIKANVFVTSNFPYQDAVGHPIDASLSGSAPGASWTQLQAMHATGLYEWQNHTQTHTDLKTQSSTQRQAEFAACNAEIVSKFGVAAPTALAYPIGSFDNGVMADAVASGLSVAFDYSIGTAQSTRFSKITDHPLTLNRLGPEIWNSPPTTKSAFDSVLDTVYVHWGLDVPGAVNASNRLGRWSLPLNGSIDNTTESIRLDGRPAGTARNAEIVDYYRVIPYQSVYFNAWVMSEVQTAGNGFWRIAEYDASRTLLRTTNLVNVTTAQSITHYENELVLGSDTRFIKFQLGYDAAYDGVLWLRKYIVRNASR